jgi:hypothetical protein
VALYEITVHFETDNDEDIERLVQAFERSICPHEATQDHRCPHRWNIMRAVLAPEEAAELDGLLNE